MRYQNIDTLKRFLSIKSISTQDEYLEEMSQARSFLKDIFDQLGFETRILKGVKHDAVFAQNIVDSNLPTVLIYGHYDVQPPDPLDQWKTPPFEPVIKNNRIFARGATDNKGQLFIHIEATKMLVEKYGHKNLPVNLKFIIEGEEEIGSVSVNNLVSRHADLLQCHAMVVSDSEMVGQNQPAIDIGLRGLLYTEVVLESAKQDLHSGQFGGVAENPAIILAHVIAELKDKDGRIKIPKFYDDITPLSSLEKRHFQKHPSKKTHVITEGNIYGIGGGESWYSLNERRWARPTLDVNGIESGYTGKGSKTIIPAKAMAKISMRLVPSQNPDKVYEEFVRYVQRLLPPTIKAQFIRHADSLPYKAPLSHPIYSLASNSLEKHFDNPPVFQGVGGSIGFIPVAAYKLGVPCVMVGFGLADENLHAPNEHFSLDNFQKGIRAMTHFYELLGQNQGVIDLIEKI